VEILAEIVSYMDLPTRQIFRTTCRILNHYIAQCHFAYHNTTIDQLEVIEQQLAQRSSDQISVDFVNPPLSFRLKALTAIKSISKFTNITSLNLLDLTSELNYKHKEDPTLLLLTSLTNLQRLAIKNYALENTVAAFNGLTKLTIDRTHDYIWSSNELLTSLKNLEDLTLPQCNLFSRSMQWENYKLTRLCTDTSQSLQISCISSITNLKQLIIDHKLQDSYATLDPKNTWTSLEHLKLAVYCMPSDIEANTNLTRLELRCHQARSDLHKLAVLTQLQIVSLDIKIVPLPVTFTFLSRLPLRSAHLSIAKLDNTQAIQYLHADLLLHLGLEIDSNSKFKDHLTRLTNLESLTLTSSKLVSVTLTPLIRLTQLVLRQVQCGAVASFTNLKVMSVFGNLRALAGLNCLTNLEQLDCALKPAELNYISVLTRLRDLHLVVKGSAQANCLTCLSCLTYLKIDMQNFPSLQWLTCLTRLNHLDLINTIITAESFELLTALSKLTQLKVNCSDTSTQVLFKLTRLQRIQLAPFNQRQPNLKEQLFKNLPHFLTLKISLQLTEDQ
jgi:hypothetical protein